MVKKYELCVCDKRVKGDSVLFVWNSKWAHKRCSYVKSMLTSEWKVFSNNSSVYEEV